jgi:dihydroflavonol-4-reductase
MNQKILITGGSGLLGSYLIRWFRQKGYSGITSTYHDSFASVPDDIKEGIRWLPLSLPDKQACNTITEGMDWVIHAAGKISYRPADKYSLLEINKTGTEHLVNACLQHQVSHFVYISSIAALGRETDHITLHEKSSWVENEWSTNYGLSKYLGELEVWRSAAEGLNVSVILPAIIMGSGDWDRSSLHMVKRIVSSPGYYPTGQTGFVDVRDVASFSGLLLEKSLSGDRWLLCGSTMKFGDVYTSLANHLGLKKSFRPAPKWLARILLSTGSLLKDKSPGIEVLRQAYGTFSFDASKSLTAEGFQYRPMDNSLREIAAAYHEGEEGIPLQF